MINCHSDPFCSISSPYDIPMIYQKSPDLSPRYTNDRNSDLRGFAEESLWPRASLCLGQLPPGECGAGEAACCAGGSGCTGALAPRGTYTSSIYRWDFPFKKTIHFWVPQISWTMLAMFLGNMGIPLWSMIAKLLYNSVNSMFLLVKTSDFLQTVFLYLAQLVQKGQFYCWWINL